MNFDDDSDDSPKVNDPTLKNPNGSYQTLISAILNDNLSQIDNKIIHNALRDIVLSDDDSVPDILEYVCSAGIPTSPLPNNDPLATIAAMRPMHSNYIKVLKILADNGFDFDHQTNFQNKTASTIIKERNPESLKIIKTSEVFW